jgi:hypothetical protein
VQAEKHWISCRESTIVIELSKKSKCLRRKGVVYMSIIIAILLFLIFCAIIGPTWTFIIVGGAILLIFI